MYTARRETLWTLDTLKEALAHLDPVYQVPDILNVEEIRVDAGTAESRALYLIGRPDLKDPTPKQQRDAVIRALENGAELAITDLPLDQFDADMPLIGVKDRVDAWSALSDRARARFDGKLIGITGSFGKSTTKDVLGQMLAFCEPTFASRGNYNELAAVHMHLASLPSYAKYAVLEVSMGRMHRKAAAINELDIGILTSIGNAHGAILGDRSGILADKIKLLQTISAQGVAIVARDIVTLDNENARFFEHFSCKIITVGQEADADVRIADYSISPLSTVVTIEIEGGTYVIENLPPGRQFAFAAAFSLATAHTLGLDLGLAARALGSFKKPKNQRGSRWKVNVGGGRALVEVIDDSQNSAPQSVQALLEYLTSRKPARKWLVMGDMRELGAGELEMHLGLKQAILDAGITDLLTVGPLAAELGKALADEIKVSSCDEAAEAAKRVFAEARQGDLIALKASGAVNLKLILQRMAKAEFRRVAPFWWLIENHQDKEVASP